MDSRIPEGLLTAQQVAEILGVASSTVYDAVYRGILPVVRLWAGRRRSLVRFRPIDIQNLIDERVTLAKRRVT